MFTKEMIDKIDSFLHKNCDIIFDFEFNGLLLLFGGAVPSLIMDLPVNDIDIVLLTQEDDNVLKFMKKYNLDYKMKSNYVYEFKYNNYSIDLSVTNDLFNCGYNTDLLFYDIHRKQIIPIGIKRAIDKRLIEIYGYRGYPKIQIRKHMKKRLEKAKKFIKFMNNDNAFVRVNRKNKYYLRLFLGFLKKPIKIKRLFWG